MENTEIQLEDKTKQLEFLKNIWKSPSSSNQTLKCNIGLQIKDDNLNIRIKSTENTQKDSQSFETEPVFSDDDFLPVDNQPFSFRKCMPCPSRIQTRGNESDEDVIHNDFYVKETNTRGRQGVQKSMSLGNSSLLIVFPGASKSGWRKGSEEGSSTRQAIRSNEEDYVCNDDERTSEANDAGVRSMFTLAVSYGPKHAGSKSINELEHPNIPLSMDYGNVAKPFLSATDDYSDDVNDDDDDYYQTHQHNQHHHCHHQHHHCHHQHHHCHHNHTEHQTDCLTHGTRSIGGQEVEQKYLFDYSDLEREPPKSSRQNLYTSTGCGQCKSCKTGNMINIMEQLTDSIDCEIHDVVPDGNCLFRSVVDQLRMNGQFHWTASKLRHLAVEFLRANPNHEDGTHLGMFLSTETWDEYLSRMATDKEWGDQLILRGISSVTERVISIISAIGSGHNQTTIRPSIPNEDREPDKEPLQLGHFDDQHYVSLRKKTWADTWFENGRKVNNIHEEDFQAKDSIDIEATTDALTSIPLKHISFLIDKGIPISSFLCNEWTYSSQHSDKCSNFVEVGALVEGLDNTLNDQSRLQISYNKRSNHRHLGLTGIGLMSAYVVLGDVQEKSEIENQFTLDFENMQPSRVKLIVIKPSTTTLLYTRIENGTAYLSTALCNRVMEKGTKMFVAIECLKWPPSVLDSWLARERPASWPTKDIISKVSKERCVVIPDNSSDRLTWRLNFMIPLKALIKSGTSAHQRHCYRIFKLLIDSSSNDNMTLSVYSVKSIFLHAMEKVPPPYWKHNKGGCLLYLLDRLLFSIQKKCIPDYFIPSWNVLEDVPERVYNSLYSRILAIRQFPITSIVLMAERHGLPGSTFAEPLIDHMESVKGGNYIEGSEKDVYFQISIEDVKNKILYYYLESATNSFVELYENFILSDKDAPSMEEFACSCLQDLPHRMQWWFYFMLDHFHDRKSLKVIMSHYGGRSISDLLGPNKKVGKFDEVRIPPPLMHDIKAYSTCEADVAFISELSSMLLTAQSYNHSAHYTMECIRLLKEKIKASTNFSQMDSGQVHYQANYKGQITTLQYYMSLLMAFRRLFTCLKFMGTVDLFSEYLEDAENACAMIGKSDNYYYLAEFYRVLGCTEKYREAIRVYNDGYETYDQEVSYD
ncbi:uncharacterized protein LOC125681796 isoform X6 [Ostrea edulis]|uniref:uncharacterized protein LOC125681796 isoform X6 n=1 Tax=Ostrea edulis TaxID=37623 RepID=UPI0024AF4FDE|nr:uncharacterized protein LOC125681796 isoform X6 [Ostrea edulis]